MKHIRAVVKVTNNRPKIRPIVILSSSLSLSLHLQPEPLGSAGPRLSRGFSGLWTSLVAKMHVCHTHRQLLSRCTLRWYSVGPSSAVAASEVQAPSRLKRPSASTFGGINIRTSRLFVSPNLIVSFLTFFFLENVVVPFRNKAKNSCTCVP